MSNSVFISYRSDVSQYLALALWQELTNRGIDVFYDVESIAAGRFDTVILSQIAARPYVVPVLEPGTLNRCVEPDDWLRRELEEALAKERVLVPVYTPKFNVKDLHEFLPDATAKAILSLEMLELPRQYFGAAVEQLANKYLVPISLELTQAPAESAAAVARQVNEAERATPVTTEQLSAEEQSANDQVIEATYTDALAAFWNRDWQKALTAFQAVIDQQADYREAQTRLEEAERQWRWETLYRDARTAHNARDFDRAVATLHELVSEAPDYRDAKLLLEEFDHERLVVELHQEARRLSEAKEYRAVINVFGRLHEVASEFGDPDSLLIDAEQALAELETIERLDKTYGQAVRKMDAGKWSAANKLLKTIQEERPDFKGSAQLLSRCDEEIAREARERKGHDQSAKLLTQIRRASKAERWQTVLDLFREMDNLGPEFFQDPEDARSHAAEQLERQIARDRESLQALTVTVTPTTEPEAPGHVELTPQVHNEGSHDVTHLRVRGAGQDYSGLAIASGTGMKLPSLTKHYKVPGRKTLVFTLELQSPAGTLAFPVKKRVQVDIRPAPPSPLTATLQLDDEIAIRGQPIAVRVIVNNTGREPLELVRILTPDPVERASRIHLMPVSIPYEIQFDKLGEHRLAVEVIGRRPDGRQVSATAERTIQVHSSALR